MQTRIHKLLAILLALAMLLSVLPTALAAPGAEEETKLPGTGLLPPVPRGGKLPSDGNSQAVTNPVTADLPSQYDSRDYGYITPVKDQGDYNTCWAFATAASCEAYMIKHGIRVGENGLPADQSLNLSEYHLAYYTYTDAYDAEGMLSGDKTYFLSSHPNGSFLEAGGTGELVSYPLMRWSGLADESDPALVYGAASQAGLGADHAYQNNVAHLSSAKHFFGSNIEAVKQHIMEYGAGAMGVRVANSTNSGYHGGVNTANGTICWIQSAVAYQDTGFCYADHDVTVVGWDDNFAKENFNQGYRPSKDGAWIVKNSWGTDTGVDGYYYVSYEDSATCASYISFFAVEELDNYDHNYQYDGSGNYYNSEELSTGDSVAQVFTANGSETLEAIALALYGDNTDYSLQIYTDCAADDPSSGTLALTQTGNFDYWGYQSIPLERPVSLNPGQRFAVVLRFSGSDINVAYDTTVQENTYYHMGLIHMTHPNTSYFKGVNDSAWTNKSGDGNYRIKAFTKDIPEDPVPVTLNCMAQGSVYDTISGTAGDRIQLPASAPAAEGWSFLGWVTAPLAETAEKPGFYKPGASFKLSSAIAAVYALYQRAEAIDAPVSYELITAAPDTWIGKYVLVATPQTGSSEFALTGLSAGADGANIENSANGASTAFASTGITRSGTTLSNVPEQYVFEAAATNYGLSLRSVSTGSYYGSKSTGSGTAAYAFYAYPEFQEANTTWTFEIDDDEMYLKNNSAGQVPYLGVSSAFGFSLTRYGSEFKFYKQNPTENYYYSTELGTGEHVHSLAYVAPVAPSCTEPGNIAHYRCILCGACFSDEAGQNQISSASVVLAALGHSPGQAQRVNETAPSCGAEGGYDELVSCTVCGQELSRTHSSIPATGEHSFGPYASNQDGSHQRLCAVCGQTEQEDCVYADTVVAPTETAQGYTEHLCTRCGYSYRDSYTAPTGSEYTVHFSVPAGVEKPADMVSNTNTGITLPVVTAPEGYSFLGWVLEDYDRVETRPAQILTGTYIAPEEVTLKALFTWFEGGSGLGYRLVTEAPADWSGTYVISYSTEEGSMRLLKGAVSTSWTNLSTAAYAVAPADAGASVNGDLLTNVADDYAFEFVPQSGNYFIRSVAYGSYIGGMSTLYAMPESAMYNSYKEWIPALSNGVAQLKNTYYNYYLNYNSGSAYFCETKNVPTDIRLWAQTQAGTAYYTTKIGPEEPEGPVEISDLEIRNNISLGAEFIINYRLVNNAAFKSYGFDSFWFEFIRHNLDGSTTTTLYGEGKDEALVANGSRSFDLKNGSIPAAEMGVTYEVIFHGLVGDQEYYTAPMTGSLKSFFVSQLESIQPEDNYGEARLRLAADSLLYGAKAQAKFNPDQGELLADLSETALAKLNQYGSFDVPAAEDQISYSDDGLVNPTIRLSLQNRLEITVRYTNRSAATPVVVEFWPEGNEAAKLSLPATLKSSTWSAVISQIGAAGVRDLYHFRVLANGVPVTNEAVWSVESYVAATRSSTDDAALVDVLNAVLNFGDSVNNLFN